jgi:hypothetical protein
VPVVLVTHLTAHLPVVLRAFFAVVLVTHLTAHLLVVLRAFAVVLVTHLAFATRLVTCADSALLPPSTRAANRMSRKL